VIERYREKSLARKPEPGMGLKVYEDFRVDLRLSAVIGDNKFVDTIKLPYLNRVFIID